MTDQHKKIIRSLLNETRNPHEIKMLTGLRLPDILAVMKAGLPDLPGWGRLELQPYIVSRRGAYDPQWPRADRDNLRDQRRLHDQGRVTMCQGRDGVWIIQYAIPTSKPVRRAPYFSGVECE